MTLLDVNECLDNIDPQSFQYWCSQDEAPAVSEVQGFFNEIEFTLPDDFRDFATSRLGGLHIEVSEEVWPRRRGGAFWWFLYGLSVFGIGREIPEWLDLRVQYNQFRMAGVPDLLPIRHRHGFFQQSSNAKKTWILRLFRSQKSWQFVSRK